MTAARKLSLLAALRRGRRSPSAGCTRRRDHGDADLVAGKQLFVEKCGSCHVLARAGTKGTTGPEPRRGLPAARCKEGFGETRDPRHRPRA